MPNRDIKESCRTSKTLALLSHGAERLFWRLTTCADDYGRMEADAVIIRSACFPRMLAKVSLANVKTWLKELHSAELIQFYQGPGLQGDRKDLLFFCTWDKHQRRRAVNSKYPSPTSDNICRPMTAHALEDTVTTVNTVNTDLADVGGCPPSAAPATLASELPTISSALDKAVKLGAVPTLRGMPFWRANIRATNGHVQYADEILKAEAWLTANPTRAPRKDLARFLHNWLSRAGERG